MHLAISRRSELLTKEWAEPGKTFDCFPAWTFATTSPLPLPIKLEKIHYLPFCVRLHRNCRPRNHGRKLPLSYNDLAFREERHRRPTRFRWDNVREWQLQERCKRAQRFCFLMSPLPDSIPSVCKRC